ncbi:MAG: restriction endonuclease [Gallionella sp.]|nr:restriction endonuclease [Gallionella sp.]
MFAASEHLEQRVQRIHELIEQPGSVVTWNDHIFDPDNVVQARQIDVTIRRDVHLTIVECRLRQRPQDVNWIEELMGRRLSLGADAVIAVSSSGFTAGARAKAAAYGVILRDFQCLTADEVKRWGHATRVSVSYMEYLWVGLDFGIPEPHWGRVTKAHISPQVVQGVLYPALNEVANRVSEMKVPSSATATAEARLVPENLLVGGVLIPEILATVKVKHIHKELNLASVVAYDAPLTETVDREVFIESLDNGLFEITQSSNQVIVEADFSSIDMPPNTQFYGATMDFGRIVRMSPRPLGIKPPTFTRELIKIRTHKTS